MECDQHSKSATVVHTVTRGKPLTDVNDSADAINSKLQKTLLDAVSGAADKSAVVEQVLSAIRAALPQAELTYVDRDESNCMSLSRAADLLEHLPIGAAENLQCWAAETCQSGETITHSLAGAYSWTTICVPVIFRDQPPEVLLAVFRESAGGGNRIAGTLQLAASHLTLWSLLQEARQLKQEAKNASALLELLASLDNSENLSDACYLLVNEVRDYLGCSRVIFGMTRRGRFDCRVVAMSGLSDFDKRSDFVHQLEATLNESVIRNATTLVTAQQTTTAEGTLAHQNLLGGTRCQQLISAPLNDAGGEIIGAWLFLEDRPESETAQTLNFVRASQTLVGSRLRMLRRSQVHPLMRPLHACCRRMGTRKWTMIALVAALLIATMAIPANYKIGCDCQLEPVSRRFIAAPYDGTLKESLVEAGQPVHDGQLLARMDARELRWQLSGLEADHESERKKRDAASARDEVALSQQSDLEMQRLSLQIELIRHRLENLDIKSPIDGVVIAGDLKKSEGVPLTIGQTMFEIGPLNKMIVEVAIPEREILYVQPGMQVELRLDAAQNDSIAGSIAKISPRSEMRDRASVYVAEVALDNRRGLLRPGMKGTAKVISQPHPIGWNLFHKAWESLAMLIGC